MTSMIAERRQLCMFVFTGGMQSVAAGAQQICVPTPKYLNF